MIRKVAVITAIYDNYDVLRPVLPQNGEYDIEWICVTDTQAVVDKPQGWTVVYNPRPGVHPNLAAKHPKMLPWLYTDAEYTIWLDASFQIFNGNFVQEALAYADPIAMFSHPERNCLYSEANISGQITFKYGGHPFPTQIARYVEQGHPRNWGLWATGVIVRNSDTRLVNFGHLWHNECEQYSFQDQVSQPAVLRSCGLYPISLPGTPYNNSWLQFRGSSRH